MELVLLAILLTFLYEKPDFLVHFANGTLGKLITVIAVILISHSHGLNAGILAAIIVIVLQHTWLEEPNNKEKKDFTENPHTEFPVESKPPKIPKATPTDSKQKKCGQLTCKSTQEQTGICVSATCIIDMENQMRGKLSNN